MRITAKTQSHKQGQHGGTGSPGPQESLPSELRLSPTSWWDWGSHKLLFQIQLSSGTRESLSTDRAHGQRKARQAGTCCLPQTQHCSHLLKTGQEPREECQLIYCLLCDLGQQGTHYEVSLPQCQAELSNFIPRLSLLKCKSPHRVRKTQNQLSINIIDFSF